MTMTNGRSAVSTSGLQFKPGFLGTMTSRVTSYLQLTKAERQLAALDDRMLADIGLRRNDIQRTVWGR